MWFAMKYFPLILLSIGSLILCWCQIAPIEMGKEDKNLTFECTQPQYYKNLKLEKTIHFTRDENKKSFTTTIPELCIKISSRPRLLSETTGDAWRQDVETYFSQYLTGKVFNNKISFGDENSERIIVQDKNPEWTLTEDIENKYYLGIEEGDVREFMGEHMCAIVPLKGPDFYAYATINNDRSTSFRLNTAYDIAKKDKDHYYPLEYSQFCGLEFPFSHLGFWIFKPYRILYDKNHPTAFILYNTNYGNAGQEMIHGNLDFEFITNKEEL